MMTLDSMFKGLVERYLMVSLGVIDDSVCDYLFSVTKFRSVLSNHQNQYLFKLCWMHSTNYDVKLFRR